MKLIKKIVQQQIFTEPMFFNYGQLRLLIPNAVKPVGTDFFMAFPGNVMGDKLSPWIQQPNIFPKVG